MTTAEQILKTNLTKLERGVPDGSHFEVTFADGSRATEHDINWSSISDEETVGYFGNSKIVHLCKLHVKRIDSFHDGLHSFIEVQEGARAYQAIRGDTLIIGKTMRKDTIVGRLIGIVKDGQIIEEHFLNGVEFKVQGLRL